jgi:hypothetical protein
MESYRSHCSEIRATGPLLHRKWVIGRGHGSKLAPTIFRESRCCPGTSSTCKKEISQCIPSPGRARQADGVPRSSSRQKRKLIPPRLPLSNPRWRKPRACARFGWPRKQPTRRLQIATRRQRRPLDLRFADMFRGDLRLHVRQNPSKGLVAPSSRRLSPPTASPFAWRRRGSQS